MCIAYIRAYIAILKLWTHLLSEVLLVDLVRQSMLRRSAMVECRVVRCRLSATAAVLTSWFLDFVSYLPVLDRTVGSLTLAKHATRNCSGEGWSSCFYVLRTAHCASANVVALTDMFIIVVVKHTVHVHTLLLNTCHHWIENIQTRVQTALQQCNLHMTTQSQDH